MTALSIETIQSTVATLPAIPSVAMELMLAFADDELETETLARKLSRDQALVVRVLRVANSPFYGLMRQICTVQEAIVVLGLSSVRTLVTAAAIIGQFPARARRDHDLHAFWQHSIGVACCAKVLCARVGQSQDTAFVCGLLHDIGRLVLVHYYPLEYAQVEDYCVREDVSRLEAERAVLGLDHAAIGAALVAHWNFPPQIQQVVAGHHLIEAAAASVLTSLTHVADVICHALEIGAEPFGGVPVLSETAWAAAQIEWSELTARFAQIETQIESASLLID
jgi:putative nucleotidyltransferase with HDIG domain